MKNWASLTCGSGARTTVPSVQGPLGSNSTGSRDENRPFYGLSEVFRVEVVVPDVPTNLTATANGSTQIDLDWNAPASDGGSAITGYRIQVSPSSGSSNWSDLVADTGNTATEYSHTGLNPGTRRFYRVQAINAVGRSSRSTVADATTHRAPGPPTLLTATANGSTQIDLSWNAPVGDGGTAVTGYKIEHTLDGGANWSDLVADTGSAATEYSDTGLPPGATRYYRVFAINAVGTSDASNVARASADLVEMEVADDWDLIPSDLGSGHRFRPALRLRRCPQRLPLRHRHLQRLRPGRAGRRRPRRHRGLQLRLSCGRQHTRRRRARQHRHHLCHRRPGRPHLLAGRQQARRRLRGLLRRHLGRRGQRHERVRELAPVRFLQHRQPALHGQRP